MGRCSDGENRVSGIALKSRKIRIFAITNHSFVNEL